MTILDAARFHNEKAAWAYVESLVWPRGPVCPHCGCQGRIGRLAGKTTRLGLRKCYDCKQPFTVKVGTIFEHSHVELRKWLQAIHLIAASKKGISSNQLSRMLGVTLKTAWFMSHRIREAMDLGGVTWFGAEGGAVEADEAYFGNNPDRPPLAGSPVRSGNKNAVLGLYDRDTGQVLRTPIAGKGATSIAPVLDSHVSRDAHLMTDEALAYRYLAWNFAAHSAVNHASGEYARGDTTTNRIEGTFSVFKRGMIGTYQHCDRRHLGRYLAEFDFRHNYRVALGVNDTERADRLVAHVIGRRLTYKRLVAKAA
jgi:transposase-like protein